MHEVRLGEKGQVTLPKAIRDRYSLAKGDEVRMIDLGNGIVEIVLLKHSSELPPPTVKTKRKVAAEEIKKAAARAAGARYKRAASNP